MTEAQLIDYTNSVTQDLKGLFKRELKRVIFWQWYSGQHLSPEPFEAEKLRSKPAKLLRSEPKIKFGKIECGLDAQGKNLLQILHDDYGRDKLFLYQSDDVIIELAFSKEYQIHYSRIYYKEHGRIIKYFHKHFIGNKQFEQQYYSYKDEVLVTSELIVTDDCYKTEYLYHYHYDSASLLEQIRADIKRDYSGEKSESKGLVIYKRKT